MMAIKSTRKYENIKLIITGYGPFLNFKENPSQILVEHITKDKENIEKALDNKILIFNSQIYEVGVDQVNTNITNLQSFLDKDIKTSEEEYKDPLYLIVHFGLDDSSKNINFEVQCSNYINDHLKNKRKIKEDGEEYYYCKLDIDTHCKRLQKSGFKTCVSNDPGTYLCNYVYYKSSELCKDYENVMSLFIHVPKISVIDTKDCYTCFIEFLKILKNNYTY